jgi:hypothetical protein
MTIKFIVNASIQGKNPGYRINTFLSLDKRLASYYFFFTIPTNVFIMNYHIKDKYTMKIKIVF